jgi:hypothetical protein
MSAANLPADLGRLLLQPACRTVEVGGRGEMFLKGDVRTRRLSSSILVNKPPCVYGNSVTCLITI